MRNDLPYSEKHASHYPPEYLAGIDLFNAKEFHAAHDAWEERWLDEAGQKEKLFLQAMIQAAVTFYLIELGRPGAARAMYSRAKEKFGRLGADKFMSLDLIRFQAELDKSLLCLFESPNMRDLSQEIESPVICLLEEVMEFD